MANLSVFASTVGRMLLRPNVMNMERAPAYEYSARHRLSQYVVTGCFNGTFYAGGAEQLESVLELAKEIDPEFISKVAIYARKQGKMKDMPALLTAHLASIGSEHFAPTFGEVINNGRMLRTFVQMIRSGVTGRKSLGSRPQRLVREWLANASDTQLVRASVGQSPSLSDIIKMVHPKPTLKARESLFGYFIERDHDVSLLPKELRDFETFKADRSIGVPAVPFQMLTSLDLAPEDWAQIARQAGWQMLRMNLNTFARHGVFEIEGMADTIAAELRDEKKIRKSGVLPYQLMVTYNSTAKSVPSVVREALQDAMEIATTNVPEFAGKVVVCPDVSGSMASPVTGYRKGATSVVRCVDVAALFSSAVLRKNPQARVMPFERKLVDINLNSSDTVMSNAQKLGSICGGGTNCSAPLARLNKEKADVDLVILVSDNQSWTDFSRHTDTGVMREWSKLKARNTEAKLVCLDMQPYGSTQAKSARDVLNVGGFSDQVFEVINGFSSGSDDPEYWVSKIEGHQH